MNNKTPLNGPYFEPAENPEKLVFLLHGWESNAGSLSKIAFSLSKNNYRVISFDLPGHANYKSNYNDSIKDLKSLIILTSMNVKKHLN